MAFFSKIQNWFKVGFDGRYLGLILLEWEKEDRAGFKSFIESRLPIKLPSAYRVVSEFSYNESKDRKADLAIFADDYTLSPIVLVEIKWNDKPIVDKSTGGAQLPKYVEYCLTFNKKCQLLLLTKDPLERKDLDEIDKLSARGTHCYFGDLLPQLSTSKSVMAKMLLEFLQDKGEIMNKIEKKPLFQFFHRFVNPYRGSGKAVSTNQLSSGPDQFKNLLNNMRLISQEISPHFQIFKSRTRSATVDFTVRPYFAVDKLTKQIGENEGGEFEPDFSSRTGGEVIVHGTETIGKSPWVQFEYGLAFMVEPNKDQNMNISAYACINGKNIEWDKSYAVWGRKTLNDVVYSADKKNELIAIFKKVIADSISKAIDQKLVNIEITNKLKSVSKEIQKSGYR